MLFPRQVDILHHTVLSKVSDSLYLDSILHSITLQQGQQNVRFIIARLYLFITAGQLLKWQSF